MNTVALSAPFPSILRRLFAAATLAVAVLAGGAALQPAAAGKIWFEGGLFGSAALRGYDVVVSVRGPTAGGFGASHWKGIYSVRSTMIGGYPSALQRRPLEEMDR